MGMSEFETTTLQVDNHAHQRLNILNQILFREETSDVG